MLGLSLVRFQVLGVEVQVLELRVWVWGSGRTVPSQLPVMIAPWMAVTVDTGPRWCLVYGSVVTFEWIYRYIYIHVFIFIDT